MNEDELDLEEQLFLEQGYAELVPSGARKEFILGALSVRLPGALAPAGVAAVGASASARWLRAKQLALGLGIGALGFGLGVAVSRSPADDAPERAGPALHAATVSGQAIAAPQGLELSELEAELPLREAQADRATKTPDAARTPSARESAEHDHGAAPAPMSFYEELSYIRRAQTALAAGNPTLALGLMRSLAELRADGALLAERDMTEVLALCALGREGEARDVGTRIRGRGDGSVYESRLHKTCARTEAADSSEDSTGVATSTQENSRRP